MDERPAARSAARRERTIEMADLRRCIGSVRSGIEAHDAPIDDFPKQPSQKDGLGRMCKPHWNAYTAGLARDAKARKDAAAAATDTESDAAVPAEPKALGKRKAAKTTVAIDAPGAEAQAEAG